VPIDRAAHERYQSLPAGPLRMLLDASVLLTPEGEEQGSPGIFAKIRMNGDNQCPLLSADRLCRIQAELGEGMLSHTCAMYPRVAHPVGGVEERALTLSCPEAARLVLLSPDLFEASTPQAEGWNDTGVAGSTAQEAVAEPLPPYFWEIRETILELIRSRVYPLWQRLFLLGLLCRRLDSIAQGEMKRPVPDFLRDFAATVATGALRTAMETLPLDRTAQLDVVLQLAGLLLHRSNVRPRFVECVQAFTTGIGNGPGATLDSLAANYAHAHDRYYEPFFAHRPHILENYLINTIFRCQFPFGKEGMRPGAAADRTREFASLTTQFALMKGLLIGVSGFHREGFSEAHVVHTVQAAAKHFEHHPEFLKMAHDLLVESRMDGARGLAILLRNSETGKDSETARVAVYAPGAQVQRRIPNP
jgi:lysine-N-methylase